MSVQQEPNLTPQPLPKPPAKPRRRRATAPQAAAAAVDHETPAQRIARERREEIAALKHDDAVSGLQKKKWLRYLLVTGIVLLFAGFAAVVGVYLALAWKAGTPFDASIINGVFGVLKEGIGSMLGL